jgi:hypothetical protein
MQPTITRNDVYDFKIDWNKWHDTVTESLHAFSFDDAAEMCKLMGVREYSDEDDDEYYDVRAGELRSNVERIIEVLIALYELKWDGISVEPGENGYKIFTKCAAFRSTSDQLYADQELYRDDEHLSLGNPCIEVCVVDDKEHGIPWFEIKLVAVGQFF